ncbi:MAG: hypothetical protein A2046_04660 [Bacteroidetes bacterium GWA2_30_7]|nr:MAG: hypothetical protein A2046_04660 [Bacteroidetes bacterium GWA2_30_7]
MILRIIIFFLIPVSCFCQSQFRFELFSIKDGLSQNTVNCTLKDSEGNYWFGTQDGLNKYDGSSVKIYRYNKNDSTTISDNFILCILEDKYSNLWIGTRNGFNFFDRKTEKFTKIIINENEKTNFHNNVFFAFNDENANIFFANSYCQFAEISHNNGQFPKLKPSVIKNNVTLFKLSTNSYCVLDSSRQKIYSYNYKNNKLLWKAENSHLKNLKAILETSDEKIIALISDTVFLLDKQNNLKPVKAILSQKAFNCFFEDSKHNIWIGSNNGLYVFDNCNVNNVPTVVVHNSENINSLSSNNIQSIYEDIGGLIWIGTSEGGVNVYDPDENCFSFFNHYSDISLSANSVYGIYQDKNELWIATNSGLNHLVFENNKITKVFSKNNRLILSEKFYENNNSSNTICSNFITCITKDKQNNFWFGSNDKGISIYNPVLKKWTQLNTKNSVLKTDVIFHLLCSSDGKIWISTMVGFYCYDPFTDQIKSFLSESSVKNGFPSGYIISIFEDSKKTIWVASTLGIFHLTNSGEHIAIYKSEVNNSKSLSYNIVTSFCEDSKGQLWITTLGGGINIFDSETETFRSLTTKDGLLNDITHKIIEDQNHNLWISTNSGLSCYNIEKKMFTNYTKNEGLIANEFSQNSGIINNDGELFFGTPEGLVVFNPAKIKSDISDIPIILSSLKINYILQRYCSEKNIDLYYNDKTVTFQFTSPDFRNRENIHYSFQLEGFDNEWHEATSSNSIATYTNLPFGKYNFKVRVRKGNEEWQKTELSVNMNVIPPFWLKTWFMVFEISAIIFIVIILVRYYSQRKLKNRLQKIEMQQKIYLERERISRDLHDNVGSHLTYIITTLDNISYKMEKGEKNVSQDKISSLSDFSRSTMQELRESIWALNKENISLTELKDKICEYSSRMASASNMNFDIEFLCATNIYLKPSNAINIYRIIQESINNSVKHSEAKNLTVTISEKEENFIYIEVKDNGKGISEISKNNGYGLKNMYGRVKDIHGQITIDSGNKGTKISFSFPV